MKLRPYEVADAPATMLPDLGDLFPGDPKVVTTGAEAAVHDV